MERKLWVRLTAAASLAAFLATALAQPSEPASGMTGPGMMGPGMMGPGMMGPGMMGPGMMGPGMMGYGYAIELTPEQRTKLSEIERQLVQQHWDLMGKMQQQRYQAWDDLRSGKFDEQAARKNYEAMETLRRQMFESWLQAQKKMDALLTAEQREELQRRWQGGR